VQWRREEGARGACAPGGTFRGGRHFKDNQKIWSWISVLVPHCAQRLWSCLCRRRISCNQIWLSWCGGGAKGTTGYSRAPVAVMSVESLRVSRLSLHPLPCTLLACRCCSRVFLMYKASKLGRGAVPVCFSSRAAQLVSLLLIRSPIVQWYTVLKRVVIVSFVMLMSYEIILCFHN